MLYKYALCGQVRQPIHTILIPILTLCGRSMSTFARSLQKLSTLARPRISTQIDLEVLLFTQHRDLDHAQHEQELHNQVHRL